MAHAIKRLANEYRTMVDPANRVCDYYAEPLEENIHEWHFTLRGPSVNGKNVPLPYKDGLYHGKLVFPLNYPFEPPDITFFTPNGRFKLNQKICSTISSFHKELWRPTYDVGLILVALRLFMGQEDEVGIGGLGKTSASEQDKLDMAHKSWHFVCPSCHQKVQDVWESKMKPYPSTAEEKIAAVPALPPPPPATHAGSTPDDDGARAEEKAEDAPQTAAAGPAGPPTAASPASVPSADGDQPPVVSPVETTQHAGGGNEEEEGKGKSEDRHVREKQDDDGRCLPAVGPHTAAPAVAAAAHADGEEAAIDAVNEAAHTHAYRPGAFDICLPREPEPQHLRQSPTLRHDADDGVAERPQRAEEKGSRPADQTHRGAIATGMAAMDIPRREGARRGDAEEEEAEKGHGEQQTRGSAAEAAAVPPPPPPPSAATTTAVAVGLDRHASAFSRPPLARAGDVPPSTTQPEGHAAAWSPSVATSTDSAARGSEGAPPTATADAACPTRTEDTSQGPPSVEPTAPPEQAQAQQQRGDEGVAARDVLQVQLFGLEFTLRESVLPRVMVGSLVGVCAILLRRLLFWYLFSRA